METPAITLARRAYNKACDVFERRIDEREKAVQAVAEAQAWLDAADEKWNTAAATVDKTFGVLRDLVAEWHAADDPPEYDPEADAADQAEERAEDQAELARIEAESDEARDARSEAAAGAFDPDALGDPDSRPVGA